MAKNTRKKSTKRRRKSTPKKTGRSSKSKRTQTTKKTDSKPQAGQAVRAPIVDVVVKWFAKDTLKVRNIEIDVLKVEKSRELKEAGSPLDVLMNITERLSTQEKSMFEVTTSGERTSIIGEFPSEGKTEMQMLFPRPARLRRVGVITLKTLLDKGMSNESAAFTLTEDMIKYYKVRDEVYVYEGKVRAPRDVYLLILETDLGRRVLRLAKKPIVERLVQHVLTPPEQEEESHGNEHGQGGDSSPS